MNFTSKYNANCLLSFIFSLVLCVFLAACGGGGGSSTAATGSGGSGSGGSGSGGSGSSGANPCNPYTSTATLAPNAVKVSIDCAVFGAVNEPFVNVTICSPNNPSSCITVDHILVDTGSVGLRVFAQPSTTAALSTLNLPSPSAYTTLGFSNVGECLAFVQGTTWGPIKSANIKIGNETANNVAIQVIGDPSFVAAPSGCTSNTSGPVESTATSFGANGLLGVGLALQDCGYYCSQANTPEPVYFNCPTSSSASCMIVTMPTANQIQNPVSLFGSDNNGVILSLGSITSPQGEPTFGGTLTFGITSTPANMLLVDANGNIQTSYNGETYTNSYIDSGSNGLYFSTATAGAIPACSGKISGFYCPTQTMSNLVAQMSGQANSTAPASITFSVANASTLFGYDNDAYSNLAGKATNTQFGNTFDWGIPFFFGRNVYVKFEDTSGNGAYFGF